MNIETAKRLYEYRKAHGFSQEELAAKIGVSRQAISKWERSESSPDTDNLIALAQLYGVSLDTLLMGENEPKKENSKEEPKAEENAESDSNTNKEDAETETSADNGSENDAPDKIDGTNTNENETENPAQSVPAAVPAAAPENYNANNAYPENQFAANTSYYTPAAKKKLSMGAKIAIGAAAAAILLIIAAAIGINIYDEVMDEREDMNQYTTETTTMPNSNGSGTSQNQSQTAQQGVYTVDPAAVNHISVEWGAGNVNVAYYDGEQIQFSDSVEENSANALVSRIEGRELKIYFCQNMRGSGTSDPKDLQINIPKSMTLTEFDIESSSANITVENIIADKMELHSNSGEINAAGEFASLDIETNSSNAQVTNTAQLIRQIDANTRSGGITVTIPQSIDGFYMEYETVSGSVSTDFSTQSSGSARRGVLNYGNSSTQIEVETTSGNFALKSAQ